MPAAKKPVARDIAYNLAKDKAAYKVVSVLQEQFKSAEKINDDGTVVAPRKLQGRLVIDAVIEAVFQYATPATLEALAADAKAKGGAEKGGKASEYIAAIVGARSVAPANKVSLESANREQLLAQLAALEAKEKPSAKTKDVAAV